MYYQRFIVSLLLLIGTFAAKSNGGEDDPIAVQDPAKPYYETMDGVGTLLMALLELATD